MIEHVFFVHPSPSICTPYTLDISQNCQLGTSHESTISI